MDYSEEINDEDVDVNDEYFQDFLNIFTIIAILSLDIDNNDDVEYSEAQMESLWENILQRNSWVIGRS